MDITDKLWMAADEALAKARALPWGEKRFGALKKASRLRNNAVNAELSVGGTFQKRSEWNREAT
jgi:hypothetical protein